MKKNDKNLELIAEALTIELDQYFYGKKGQKNNHKRFIKHIQLITRDVFTMGGFHFHCHEKGCDGIALPSAFTEAIK